MHIETKGLSIYLWKPFRNGIFVVIKNGNEIEKTYTERI